MKTNDLIEALVADAAPRGPSLRATVFMALVFSAVIAAAVMSSTLGMRQDAFTSLVHSPRFVFKFVFTFTVFASALYLSLRLARPGTVASPLALALPLVVLVGGVTAELVALPEKAWMSNMVGRYWYTCLTFGPLISLGPLAVLLIALKRGAPENPTRAGFVAGLAAGGIGTFFYAAHCPDDSPLFVALWYTIVVLMMGAIGALIGSRVLRW